MLSYLPEPTMQETNVIDFYPYPLLTLTLSYLPQYIVTPSPDLIPASHTEFAEQLLEIRH